MVDLELDTIHTYADGRPIEGHPGPPPEPSAGIETKIAWMRAANEYRDRVVDVGNKAFADQFTGRTR